MQDALNDVGQHVAHHLKTGQSTLERNTHKLVAPFKVRGAVALATLQQREELFQTVKCAAG